MTTTTKNRSTEGGQETPSSFAVQDTSPSVEEALLARVKELEVFAGSCAEGQTEPEFSRFLHIEAHLRQLHRDLSAALRLQRAAPAGGPTLREVRESVARVRIALEKRYDGEALTLVSRLEKRLTPQVSG